MIHLALCAILAAIIRSVHVFTIKKRCPTIKSAAKATNGDSFLCRSLRKSLSTASHRRVSGQKIRSTNTRLHGSSASGRELTTVQRPTKGASAAPRRGRSARCHNPTNNQPTNLWVDTEFSNTICGWTLESLINLWVDTEFTVSTSNNICG